MTEPSAAVLAEQIHNLRVELKEMKKEMASDIKVLETRLETTTRMANSSEYTMNHMKETFADIKTSINNFYATVNEQNKKMDEFINSDKRRNSNRQMVISVLQVLSGLIVAILGFWAGGKF